MKVHNLFGVASLFTVLFSGFLMAELPPDVYKELKKNSPEKLDILVTESHSWLECGCNCDCMCDKNSNVNVEAKATIDKVFRTQSGLVKGQSIDITYQIQHHDKHFVGPAQPTQVKTGKHYMAFLTCYDTSCSLSARGWSLTQLQCYDNGAMEPGMMMPEEHDDDPWGVPVSGSKYGKGSPKGKGATGG